MKKGVLLFMFLCTFSYLSFAQNRKETIIEDYYFVSQTGDIDYNTIFKTRTIKYDNNGVLIFCKNRIRKNNHLSDSNKLDFLEHINSNDTLINHFCKYNENGDLIKHTAIIKDKNKEIVVNFSYEYLYLGAFTYKSKNERLVLKDYIPTGNWVRRTTFKDGKVIEVINRKIYKTR